MIFIKRTIAVLTALTLCLGLFGCGKTSSSSGTSSAAGQNPTQQALSLSGASVLSYNSLTGEPLAEGVSEGQRPVAVMVNNAQAALPQRGIGAADAIFEMVTEGGVTRLMALYSNFRALPQVGPVRSARDQHLQFAIPLNAIYVHIGSSIYAENLLNTYSYQDIDGLYLGTTAFEFDAERAKTIAQEHCWYTNGALVTSALESKQMPVTGESHPLFSFAADDKKATVLTGEAAPDVQFSFSPSNTVRLTYNAEDGTYYKQAYGQPHIDEVDGSQLHFKNVFVLQATIGMKPDNYCTDFVLTSGTGYYISGGKSQKILWKKGNPEDPLLLTDESGKEIVVETGKSYIGLVGSDMMSTLMLNAAAPAAPVSAAPAQ